MADKEQKPGLDLSKVKRLLRSLPYHYVKPYLALLLGYLLITLPIWLGLFALAVIPQLQLNSWQNWLMALGAASFAGFNFFIAFQLFKVKPKLPSGLAITEAQLPKVFALISDLGRDYKGVKIHRVILTLEHDITIIKSPLFGLPIWYKTTLSIGLPTLLMVDVDQFSTLMSRRFGQNSFSLNLFTTWLIHHRNIWRDYQVAYSERKKFYRIASVIFRIYCSLYERASNFMVSKGELDADSHALRTCNDEDTLLTIEQYTASRVFLEHLFIPKINKLPPNSAEGQKPLMLMAKQMKGFLAKGEGNKWLTNIIEKPVFGKHYPSLHERMDNIGHGRVLPLPITGKMAAEDLLGKMLANVLESMNKMWHQRATVLRMAHDKKAAKAKPKKVKA